MHVCLSELGSSIVAVCLICVICSTYSLFFSDYCVYSLHTFLCFRFRFFASRFSDGCSDSKPVTRHGPLPRVLWTRGVPGTVCQATTRQLVDTGVLKNMGDNVTYFVLSCFNSWHISADKCQRRTRHTRSPPRDNCIVFGRRASLC